MFGLRKMLAAGLILLVLSGSTFAFEKTGTTAAAFLQIPVGARLSSMSKAGVALQGGPEMLATNPAAAWSENINLNVTYLDWFAGLQHQSAAITIPHFKDLVLGLHVVSFGGDDFEQTTLQEQEGAGVMVNYSDLAVGGSVIGRLTDRFTVGLTAKYIRQQLFNETASTFAFDVGTHLTTDLRGFSIGMAMTNLGGEMQLSGRDLYLEDPAGSQYETSKWPLPLSFQTGIGWRLLGQDWAFKQNNTYGLSVAADARHLNEGTTTVCFGLEGDYQRFLFLRSGYEIGHDTNDFTFGAGVRVVLYNVEVLADLALAEMGDLGQVQWVGLTIGQRAR